MTKLWSPTQLMRLLRIERTKTSLLRDEAAEIIPKAQHIKRGTKTFGRAWRTEDLPFIGRVHGFLPQARDTKIISVYTPKGGVLKTTLALNLARVLAINGIKVLVIGLDIQGSITHNLRVEEPEIDSIEFIKNIDGLYEGIQKNNVESVIQQTDIPMLDYIPENTSLNLLEQSIRDKTKREHFFSRYVKPLQKKYEVIIFDNSPNWNFLIQNSLVAATDVISPVACDIETFRSLAQNIEMISDFKKTMELDWNNFILVPTKLERTKISTQIEAQYRTMFPQLMSYSSIRASVKGQESSLEKMSVLEYDCTSVLALDYYEVLIDLWNKINK